MRDGLAVSIIQGDGDVGVLCPVLWEAGQDQVFYPLQALAAVFLAPVVAVGTLAAGEGHCVAPVEWGGVKNSCGVELDGVNVQVEGGVQTHGGVVGQEDDVLVSVLAEVVGDCEDGAVVASVL